MSSTMFLKKMLYIPDYVVYEDIPKIIKYFDDFSIAKVKNVQVFKHLEDEYYDENHHCYGYALIEIEYYYYNQGSCNFYNSIENNKGIMVYDDPLYWEVQFSPFKEHNSYNTPNYDVYDLYDNGYYVGESLSECIGECVSEQDYYTSEEDNKTKDPDYVNDDDDDDSSSDDDYNYESYKQNYNSFKIKQKVKLQKLNQELIKLKKTLELIKNKQEQMHALLISNNKVKSKGKGINKDNAIVWTRRLRLRF